MRSACWHRRRATAVPPRIALPWSRSSQWHAGGAGHVHEAGAARHFQVRPGVVPTASVLGAHLARCAQLCFLPQARHHLLSEAPVPALLPAGLPCCSTPQSLAPHCTPNPSEMGAVDRGGAGTPPSVLRAQAREGAVGLHSMQRGARRSALPRPRLAASSNGRPWAEAWSSCTLHPGCLRSSKQLVEGGDAARAHDACLPVRLDPSSVQVQAAQGGAR